MAVMVTITIIRNEVVIFQYINVDLEVMIDRNSFYTTHKYNII